VSNCADTTATIFFVPPHFSVILKLENFKFIIRRYVPARHRRPKQTSDQVNEEDVGNKGSKAPPSTGRY
jgi:hypothetical protein